MVKQNLSIGLKKGIKKSNKLYSQALKMIASGTNTFSRAPGVFPDGASPKFLEKQKEQEFGMLMEINILIW